MKSKLHLCIHGHFYQPPRENPLSGEIPVEKSAAPFNNWNERIFRECYEPNTEAVIIDNDGTILKKVNNYKYLSFNFGPTLSSWMQRFHPDTFQKIIEADKRSVDEHSGHGNAIAQVYNHIIMPLANERDKETQIKWGLQAFEYYFGRASEGIWLAETACNYDTLRSLIKEKIKFVILDPSQALKVREIGDITWVDVQNGNINPKMPYRCYLDDPKTSKDEYIDIFFYDGPIAKSMAFEDIALSPEKLFDRINAAAIPNYEKEQLISISVDGETFGHHKKFADRSLAYFLEEIIPKADISIVNFGEYLEMYPPEHEVRIKHGRNEEGTSWSCSHGVGRWKENCGCSISGLAGWNQLWREPLRNAMNQLRDKLSVIFELEGRKYFDNVWEVRNEYINIINFYSDKSKESNRENNILKKAQSEFLKNWFKKDINESDIGMCIDLLEMEKYSMFMFTSCGWFFDDISGLESAKILQYAQRAIELAEKITDLELEKEFTDILGNAKSNIFSEGNGKEIYFKLKEDEKRN